MTLKKIFGKLHLWLGLSSGLIVFIVGLTGAVYCFAPELQNMQPCRWVKQEGKPFLPPARIQQIAEDQLPGKSLQRIYYDARDKAVMVLFTKADVYSYAVFINPYNGKVLKVRDNGKDFLSVVLQIHRTLLIPHGHYVIRWNTVIFIFMLISGMILWWPRKTKNAKHGFKIMWKASPKRLNYDLHKVLGFYISWIVIFSALTGLMFTWKAFAGLVYKYTGFEHSTVQTSPPISDSTGIAGKRAAAIDLVWKQVAPDLYEKYASLMFVLPSTKNGAILVRANPEKETLYKTDFRYFDPFNGKAFPGAYVWGNYTDASTTADYIKRMNYDIHTGAIFGFPGRVILFFIAVIVTSLPVTGFLYWWGRKHKK